MAAPQTVVVADDSRLARKQLIKVLPEDWKAAAVEASNGQEALEAYFGYAEVVLFLDLTMPDMDGFEVLQALHDKGEDHRTIVVSADIQEDAQNRVLALGALDFLAKPVDHSTLAEVLQKAGMQ
ncbi:response regulator [Thiohalorhabdus sp.]|uniref:response regulator n=1 Tax=Thiohalorhabdus sp. TaxID=3094134 RepID=UPI002FC2DB3D